MTDRAVVVSAGEIDRVHRDQKVSVHESLVPAEPLSFCLPMMEPFCSQLRLQDQYCSCTGIALPPRSLSVLAVHPQSAMNMRLSRRRPS